jgi:TPR repeat protein
MLNQPSWIPDSDLPSLEKAAEKGDSLAASRLGRYYTFLTSNRAKALMYYRIAAKSGDAQAMYNLGFELIRSKQPSEEAEGERWLKAARAKGITEAGEILRLNGVK